MSDRYDFMSDNNNSNNTYAELSLEETKTAFIKSYLWMFAGALLTFLLGLLFSKVLVNFLVTDNSAGTSLFLILFFIAFAVELVMGFAINKNALVKLNYGKALAGFIIYSALNGFTFSFLFAFFDVSVLYQVFGVVALYYLVLTAISYLFRNKIQKLTGFAYVGLITLLVVSVLVTIYSFLIFPLLGGNSDLSMLYLGVSFFGLVVFTILTLVDIRNMKSVIEYSSDKRCASVAAAFNLYLDFINIFIYVLRIVAIFGRSRR